MKYIPMIIWLLGIPGAWSIHDQQGNSRWMIALSWPVALTLGVLFSSVDVAVRAADEWRRR